MPTGIWLLVASPLLDVSSAGALPARASFVGMFNPGIWLLLANGFWFTPAPGEGFEPAAGLPSDFGLEA